MGVLIRTRGTAMSGAPGDCAAFDETVVFLSHFRHLEDPRQQGKVSYPLEEILLLCLLAAAQRKPVDAGAAPGSPAAGATGTAPEPSRSRTVCLQRS